ncbi:MAG: beta-phosphoglucomutase [Clostridia bacterium]|nr:beta-phosphoglucomutase [Clostridia bacterium]
MRRLEAVIFDLDGVLTETSRQHFLAWKQLAEGLSFMLPDEMNERLKGISRMESLEIILEAAGMTDRFTESEKVELTNFKNNIYKSMIKKFTKENLSEGALDLLVSLRENNIKIALASVSKNAPFLLNAMGIEGFFDAVADPNEIKRGKPAPDIFLAAAELLKVPPHNCIGIEDAFAGIEAIKAAGMIPVGIGRKEELSNCELVVSGLRDVNLKLLMKFIEN